MNTSRPRMALRILILVLLAFALYFWGLGNHGLLEPDEGRYSEIPREMRESGDFITPKLNYIKYFEKPVLHYWLTASAQAVFVARTSGTRGDLVYVHHCKINVREGNSPVLLSHPHHEPGLFCHRADQYHRHAPFLLSDIVHDRLLVRS